MKKIRFFDLICIFALISLSFSVGFHIGRSGEDTAESEALVTVKLYKAKHRSTPDELLIDGKYECGTVSLEGDMLTVRCKGKTLEAGFLFSGAKYISVNQPLEILGDGNYFYGRIHAIVPV